MPETYTLTAVGTGDHIDLILPNVRLRNVDGLGMPDVKHFTEDYAQQEGEAYLGSRLKPRHLLFSFQLVYDTEADLWTARDDLMRVVSVLEDGVYLRVTMPNGDEREIVVRYSGGLSLPRSLEHNLLQQVCVLECIAHDPLFYDPATVTLYYIYTDVGNNLPFDNLGSWITYPEFVIGGPLNAPIIHHGSQILDLSAFNIAAGRSVHIDLRPGHKTITESVVGNILPYLTEASDLATFAFEPGGNVFRLNGNGETAATTFAVAFKALYVGV